MSEISQRERELLNEVAALRRRVAREETKEFSGTVTIGTTYPKYSGVPTAGAIAYWTGNGTIAAASFGTGVVARYSGVPTAGAMAYWTANGTVAAAGFGTSTVAQYSGTQSAGVFAYFTGTGTVTASATYGTATMVTLNVGDGRYGLLATANTWTANNAFNSTAPSGNALSVTRNLTSTSTDAPVASIVQDHASDDQAALRVQQDGTGHILDLYDGASLVFSVADGGSVNATGAVDFDSTLNVDGAATFVSSALISGFLRTVPTSYTVASGAITVTGSFALVAGEGGASDDLTTINGGTLGDHLFIRRTSAATTLTVKDGTGNIILAGDFAMNTINDTLHLIYIDQGGFWAEISRSDNS